MWLLTRTVALLPAARCGATPFSTFARRGAFASLGILPWVAARTTILEGSRRDAGGESLPGSAAKVPRRATSSVLLPGVDLDRLLDSARKALEARFLDPSLKDVVVALNKILDDLGRQLALPANERRTFVLNLLMLRAAQDPKLAGPSREDMRADGVAASALPAADRESIANGARYAQFAAAAYGVFGNLSALRERVAGAGLMPPPHVWTSMAALQRWYVSVHTGVAPEDVLRLDSEGTLECRAHLLAVDRKSLAVVLAVRGTFSLTDTVMDVLCDTVPFHGGRAHRGMHRSAEQMLADVGPAVADALNDNPGYKLALCGHSLGAGTVIILHAMLTNPAAEGSPPSAATAVAALPAGTIVECYALAPPPLFGPSASLLPAKVQDGIRCFVYGNDIVPRLSVAALLELSAALRRVDRLPLTPAQRVQFLLDYWGGWLGSSVGAGGSSGAGGGTGESGSSGGESGGGDGGGGGGTEAEENAALPPGKQLRRALGALGGPGARSPASLADALGKVKRAIDADLERLPSGLRRQLTELPVMAAAALPAALEGICGPAPPAAQIAALVNGCYPPVGAAVATESDEAVVDEGSKNASSGGVGGGDIVAPAASVGAAAEQRTMPLEIPGRLYWLKELKAAGGTVPDDEAAAAAAMAQVTVVMAGPKEFSRAYLVADCISDHFVDEYERVMAKAANE